MLILFSTALCHSREQPRRERGAQALASPRGREGPLVSTGRQRRILVLGNQPPTQATQPGTGTSPQRHRWGHLWPRPHGGRPHHCHQDEVLLSVFVNHKHGTVCRIFSPFIVCRSLSCSSAASTAPVVVATSQADDVFQPTVADAQHQEDRQRHVEDGRSGNG